jgi:hypothetical protein
LFEAMTGWLAAPAAELPYERAARRGQGAAGAALIGLAAQLPAAILADTLNLSAGTAVRWMHLAGADWNRYAADLARSRDH